MYAQESPAFEKIRDVSPGGKFAVRILCSSGSDYGGRTRFTAVESRQVSNYVKEKHPINE
jgi:hypothetical protein